MDDKKQELLDQFDFPIYHMYRTRGAFLLQTDIGLCLLRNFTGSIPRLEFEDCLKNKLVSHGFSNVDTYIKNKQGSLLSADSYFDKFICKNWYEGEECNLRNTEKVLLAVKNLAILHKHLYLYPISAEEESPIDYRSFPGNIQKNLKEVFRKRTRELERVRCYLRGKNQKSDFEVFYLGICNDFYNQALCAAACMETSNYQKLYQEALEHCLICHGNYTQHNVLLHRDGVATLNFEKAVYGLQITDFYHFLRKTMEKNDWDWNLGLHMIETYHQKKEMSKEEYRILFLLLCYPEKFWKITNSYYNSKKSWIPFKNLQKLIAVQEQIKPRQSFLEQMERLNLF